LANYEFIGKYLYTAPKEKKDLIINLNHADKHAYIQQAAPVILKRKKVTKTKEDDGNEDEKKEETNITIKYLLEKTFKSDYLVNKKRRFEEMRLINVIPNEMD
jgi:hypothetical protein